MAIPENLCLVQYNPLKTVTDNVGQQSKITKSIILQQLNHVLVTAFNKATDVDNLIPTQQKVPQKTKKCHTLNLQH